MRDLLGSLCAFIVLGPLLICTLASAAPPRPFQDTEIDNARVIELTRMGLGDEIIIAKIKTTHPKFW